MGGFAGRGRGEASLDVCLWWVVLQRREQLEFFESFACAPETCLALRGKEFL